MSPLFRLNPGSMRNATVRRRVLLGATFGLMFSVVGCRDGKVAAYRIPKEHDTEMTTADAGAASPQGAMPAPTAPAMAAPQGGMTATPMATATGAVLTWTAPAWQDSHWLCFGRISRAGHRLSDGGTLRMS